MNLIKIILFFRLNVSDRLVQYSFVQCLIRVFYFHLGTYVSYLGSADYFFNLLKRNGYVISTSDLKELFREISKPPHPVIPETLNRQ